MIYRVFNIDEKFIRVRFLNVLMGCLLISILWSCGGETETNKNVVIDKVEVKPVVQAAVFNPDSAYTFIEKQVSFGPRIPNTSAHVRCSDYLVQRFKKYSFYARK